MVRQSVLCEVNQYVFRNYCQYSPVACSLLTLQPVCQLSDCCLTRLQCVWLYSFSRQISCCCQAFAIQVCYCLLAELRCDGAVDGSCTQAGVQLGEATCMQAWGGLQCVYNVMAWGCHTTDASSLSDVCCLPIPANTSCQSWVAATITSSCSCTCWFG